MGAERVSRGGHVAMVVAMLAMAWCVEVVAGWLAMRRRRLAALGHAVMAAAMGLMASGVWPGDDFWSPC